MILVSSEFSTVFLQEHFYRNHNSRQQNPAPLWIWHTPQRSVPAGTLLDLFLESSSVRHSVGRGSDFGETDIMFLHEHFLTYA